MSQAKNRKTLIALAILFMAPVLTAIALNLPGVRWNPQANRNHGELVTPVQPAPAEVQDWLASEPLLDRWRLLYWHPSDCESNCQEQVDLLHRVHLLTGRNFDRVVLVVASDPQPLSEDVQAVDPNHDGLQAWLSAAGPLEPGSAVLIDPLGNLMMRYAPGFDPSGVRKDLQHLLRWSKLGKQS